MDKRRANLIFSALMIILCFFTLYWMRNFPVAVRGMGYGPDLFPKIVISVIFLLSAIILFQNLYFLYKERREESKGEVDLLTFHNAKILGLLLFIFFIYVLLFPRIGFIVATFLFLFISMILMKISKPKSLIITLVLTVILFYTFKVGLRVPLPTLF